MTTTNQVQNQGKNSKSDRSPHPTPQELETEFQVDNPAAAFKRVSASAASIPNPDDILTLQRKIGNKAVARMMGKWGHAPRLGSRNIGSIQSKRQKDRVQRHPVGATPSLEEERGGRVQAFVQRHSIQEAPRLPEELVQAKSILQRSVDVQRAFGRAGANGIDSSLVQREKTGGAASKAATDIKGGTATKSKEAGSGAVAASLGKMDFSPDEVPSDGKTTASAKVTGGAGRSLKWDFVGARYGSTVSGGGVVTPGIDTKGKEKLPLVVKAMDAKDTSISTTGTLTLWDAKFFQAKKDYDDFVKGGPYTWPNFSPNNWSMNAAGKFTAYNWGKFDVRYSPAAKMVDMDIRVRFQFIDDQPKTMFFGMIPLESRKTREEREKRHDLYSQAFEQQVVAGWSQQFDFQNIRAPQSVWGKLNPTQVRVNVQDVDRIKGGGKAGAHHWTIKVKLKSTGRAEVINASNLVKFYKGDDKASMAFNPGTSKGELKRVRRIAPSPILFQPAKTDIKSAEAIENLQYFGTYLKRINNPQFKVSIVGHANATGKKDENQKYSEERAKSVKDRIVAGGIGPHSVTAKGVGDAGATADSRWRKVTIGVDMGKAGWKNFSDVTLHEFGHMIGLDDEYTRVGDSRKFADHYILIKKAFGDKYAKEVSKIPGAESASVMYQGNDVRLHHYVTFWQALYETTKAKAPAPKERFGFKDWKFVE